MDWPFFRIHRFHIRFIEPHGEDMYSNEYLEAQLILHSSGVFTAVNQKFCADLQYLGALQAIIE